MFCMCNELWIRCTHLKKVRENTTKWCNVHFSLFAIVLGILYIGGTKSLRGADAFSVFVSSAPRRLIRIKHNLTFVNNLVVAIERRKPERKSYPRAPRAKGTRRTLRVWCREKNWHENWSTRQYFFVLSGLKISSKIICTLSSPHSPSYPASSPPLTSGQASMRSNGRRLEVRDWARIVFTFCQLQ